MVNIIVNKKNDPSLTYNVSTDTISSVQELPNIITNATEKMAEQAGLTDMANQLNEESQSYDQQLRETGSEENNSFHDMNLDEPTIELSSNDNSDERSSLAEEEKRKKKIARKKSKTQDRFEDLTVKYSRTIQEKDAYKYKLEEALAQLEEAKKLNAENAKALLSTQHNMYEKEIEEAHNIMFDARKNEDAELEKKASKIINQLQYQQLMTQQQIDEIASQHDAEVQQKSIVDPRESFLMQSYDKRELEGEGLENWLTNNPECNPYSKDFDQEYSEEIFHIKKNLNKWLTGQRQKSLIGTPEYYDLLDQSISQFFGRNQMSSFENHRNYYTDNAARESSANIPTNPNGNSYQETPQYYPEYTQQYSSPTTKLHTVNIPLGSGNPLPAHPIPAPTVARYNTSDVRQPYNPASHNPNNYRMPTAPVSRVSRDGYNNPNTRYNGYTNDLDPLQTQIALSIMPRIDVVTGQQLTDAQRIAEYKRNMTPRGGR